MSILIDNVGSLVTNDPELGEGPLGIVEDAALVLGDGVVVWAGPRAATPEGAADERFDAGGRAVIPGFVDSHAHLVFAGDRAREFAARMAGERYEAGGIRTTVAATRAATEAELDATTARLVAEARRSGTTTIECKSGYGLTVADEARSLSVAGRHTDEVTYLGAHVVAPEYAGDPAAYVELVTGPMLDACAPHARWIDVFCERGAFDGDQARAILRGRQGARPDAARARQPARPRPGRAARGRARRRLRRPRHPRHGRRRRRARERRDRRDAAARRGVLDPRRLSGRAPAARRGRDRRARRRLQPRHELHDEHPVLHRARRARDGHDARTRPSGRRPPAAPARCAATTSDGSRPGARADAVLLDAPSHLHLAYRPGVALAAAVWRAGTRA